MTKYLLKETTREEAAAVRRWIATHPDNERYYSRLRSVWDASRQFARESEVDEEAAWHRFLQRRESADSLQKPSKGIVRRISWLRVAVMVVLGMFTAFAGYHLLAPHNNPLLGVTHRTADATSTDTLVDGSVITLSKYASLRFSRGLFQQRRLVDLHEGGVFFRVAPDRDKPFVIRSGNVTVTVLGTSFHVKRKGDETAVEVESGRVKVEGLDKAVILSARQRVIINTKTHQFDEGTAVEVLDRTPLWRVAELLEDAYDVEVAVADGIRDLPMTTTLDMGRLDTMLKLIAETLGVTVEKKGNRVIIK